VASPWRTIALDRGDAGRRVDLVLLRHLRDERGVSRNRIQKWIEAGDVVVNGTPANRAAWRVQAGDELKVRLAPPAPRARPKAEAIPLDILYEDDHLLAVNKPAGMVSHPSYKNAGGTLINGVLDLAREWPAGSKPGLLGRLDKQTSGVALITKRSAVHAALQRAADARRVDKDYLAVVWGKPTPVRGTIDLAIDRDPWDRRKVTVTDRGGQPSVTRYERLAVSGNPKGLPPQKGPGGGKPSGSGGGNPSGLPVYSLGSGGGNPSGLPVSSLGSGGGNPSGLPCALVRCRLITGRMHQIRVHLAAKGWPIVGDPTYGRRDATIAFPRQALHAWRLAFRHPVTGTQVVITAPLPADMKALCEGLGLEKS